jgi:hypothetical protein
MMMMKIMIMKITADDEYDYNVGDEDNNIHVVMLSR